MGVRPEIVEARNARTELGLGLDGPIDDILRVIEEDAEIPVAVLTLPEGLAGMFRRHQEQPLIAINGTQPVVRQRFTLAHEFGHYRLKHDTVIDRGEDIFGRSSDPQEVQANYFAGEFLAPRPAVASWLEAHGDPPIDLTVIVQFAARFGLSAKAARVRFETARLIDRKQAAALDREIEAGHHKEIERELHLAPVADTLWATNQLPRIPQSMERRARRLYSVGLMDVEELAQRTGQDPKQVVQLLEGAHPPESEDAL